MKKVFLALTIVALPLVSYSFWPWAAEQQAVPSVEFGIAEPSPRGIGYAMPASGNSGITDDWPGCNLNIVEDRVLDGDNITIEWEHGATAEPADDSSIEANANPTLIGSISGFDSSGWRPDRKNYTNKVRGESCIAYCDITEHNCDLDGNFFDNAAGLIEVDAGGTGGTKSAYVPVSFPTNPLLALSTAHAKGGGNKRYTCKGADQESGQTTVEVGDDDFQNGIFRVALVTRYEDSYGGHHSRITENACFDTIVIDPADEAELVPSTSAFDEIFPAGQPLDIDIEIDNLGMSTDHVPGDAGNVTYSTYFLTNVADVDATLSGLYSNFFNPNEAQDRRDDVGASLPGFYIADTDLGVMGEGSNRTDTQTYNTSTDFPPGNHIMLLCVNEILDTSMTPRVTEQTRDNNCIVGSFTVGQPDLQATAGPRNIPSSGDGTVFGIVRNGGTAAVTDEFVSRFLVRVESDPDSTNWVWIDNAANEDNVAVGGARAIWSDPFDFAGQFGTGSNLEYQFWVDTGDAIAETPIDNTPLDMSGNNNSPWRPLTFSALPDITVSPQWGFDRFAPGSNIALEFALFNETGGAVTTPFDSTVAIDADSDCDPADSHTDSCVEHVIDVTGSTIPVSGIQRETATRPPLSEGTYRAKVFADVDDDVTENDDNNNESGWVEFTVSPVDSGGDVTLEVTPTVIKQGDEVTFTWDLNGNPEVSCELLQNDSVVIHSLSVGQTEHKEIVRRTSQFTLRCGPYEDTVTVTAVPILFET